MPFQVVSDAMLESFADAAKRVYFKAGELIYERGARADEVFVVMSGRVQHLLGPGAGATNLMRDLQPGEVFGWAALLKGQPYRLARATALEDTECLVIDGNELLRILESDPETGNVVMSRFATMITRDFSVPQWVAQVQPILAAEKRARHMTGLSLTMLRLGQWMSSPRPYLMVIGFSLFFGFWFVAVEVWRLPRFMQMPGLTEVVRE